MNGSLLLVIPPVIRKVDGVFEAEVDFSHNLIAYLANFSHVTIASPMILNDKKKDSFRSVPLSKIKNSDRLTYISLPFAYREDKYLRHYLKIRTLLRTEIARADYLLFSPHAKYDWATLAALQAIKMKRKFDIESDWAHESVQRLQLASLPLGLNKVRKTLWMHSFLRTVRKCFANSSLALLQGQDVFDTYKYIAPNPQRVLNVQVSSEDYLSPLLLDEKLRRIMAGNVLTISYAGRMVDMKGPLDWLKAIHGAVDAGVTLQAVWYGDGPLMPQMQKQAAQLGLKTKIRFPGVVGRKEVMTGVGDADLFLFCHKTKESPRCLGEALAAGCAIVGYDSAYSRELIAIHGGGEFVEVGNWQALTDIIVGLDRDREKLKRLTKAAAASGKLLDRDRAMQNRIDLIKKYLSV